MRLVAGILAFILAAGAAAEPDSDPTLVVPMVKLLVDPEGYVGQRISVFGYSMGITLHLTEDHARYIDPVSQVWINDHTEGEIYNDCGERYVRVEGRLERHQGTYILTDLSRVWDATNMKYCWGGTAQ